MKKEVMIVKRGGAHEPYDPEKISRVVQAAGLRPIDAEELSEKITAWVEKQEKNKITSIEIRDRVFKELQKTDEYASGLFAWYQNLKDKRYKESAHDDKV